MSKRTPASLRGLSWAFLLLPAVAAAEGLKIGVIDAERILKNSPQAEQATKQLEKEFAARDKELKAHQKAVKELEDKLAKEGAVMSEAELQKLERELATKRRELRREQEEYRDDLTLRRNEELGKALKEIESTILAFAKEQGYDMVLSQGVLYWNSKVDITNVVLERLRKASGASAAGGEPKADKAGESPAEEKRQ